MSGQENVQALADKLIAHLDETIAAKSSWSFTQAFILGQLTVIIVLVAFIRYLVLEEETGRWSRKNRKTKPVAFATQPALSNAELLSKLCYNMDSHTPESIDWLNVLVAKAINGYREEAKGSDAILLSLAEALNGPRRPDWLAPIQVTDMDLGEEFPNFSKARILPSEDGQSMRAEIDLNYIDSVTLGISTAIVVNWPKPSFARLPISLGVTIEKVTATLLIEFASFTSIDNSAKAIHVSILPDWTISLGVTSFLGAYSQLQDLPKVTQLIKYNIQSWVRDHCVYPRYQIIPLPRLWKVQDSEMRVEPMNTIGHMSESGEELDLEENDGDIANDIEKSIEKKSLRGDMEWMAQSQQSQQISPHAIRSRQTSGVEEDSPDPIILGGVTNTEYDGLDLDLDNMTSVSMRMSMPMRARSTSTHVNMPGAVPVRRRAAGTTTTTSKSS